MTHRADEPGREKATRDVAQGVAGAEEAKRKVGKPLGGPPERQDHAVKPASEKEQRGPEEQRGNGQELAQHFATLSGAEPDRNPWKSRAERKTFRREQGPPHAVFRQHGSPIRPEVRETLSAAQRFLGISTASPGE
jgi:hypothetical protein